MARPVREEELEPLRVYLTTQLPGSVRFADIAYHSKLVGIRYSLAQFQFDRNRVEVWAEDPDSLKRLLDLVIDWTQDLYFVGMSVWNNHLFAISRLLRSFFEFLHVGLQLRFKPTLLSCVPQPDKVTFSEYDRHVFLWPKARQPPNHVEIPAGMHLERLRPVHAEKVAANWRHTSHPVKTRNFICCLIRNLHSSCLLDEHGTMVGYCAQHHNGAIGFLHVEPAYRRRGFATILLKDMVRQVAGVGQQIYLQAESYNTHSMGLASKLGLHRFDKQLCTAVWKAS